ncbi:hypothetical protein ACSET8_02720 [Pseudomonas aeruginosa]|uniref:hypothetical protein n=1 Tax=Pseudomonas aeruginosa TaxID=287 RepID=UPI001A3059D4|nr:hypothetical protein [Pseudomonas aeruginosa]MBH3499129.1 hypothetical protein [Pseudomonas aeruginosa]MBV5888779.1 hypothetical protein [Pseudomonas aeruginosa]MDA3430846.1 hypothetical protein [Pseudomonas aeruginosa]MDU0508393.1 hypothetical protein [Pseudomonas aeruginosa]HEJ5564170.1 hypothetical protein [Pseudomonas aeruginosa]
MTESKICTCPSGDGSLRHPCPAHIGPFDKLVGSPVHNESEPDLAPLDEHLAQVFETGMALSESVEQAGGDRWDALQSIMEWTAAENIPDDRKLCLIRNAARAALAIASSAQTEHERDMLGQALGECIEAAGITTPGTPLTGPQLLMFAADLKRDLQRAALAQPSPASDLDPLNLAPHAEAFNEAPAEALMPGQAEAERPEVVAYVRTSLSGPFPELPFPRMGEIPHDFDFEKFRAEPLMTVAQHERIVGALTRDHAHVEEHLSQQIDILRINLAAKRDNLDAALARVAELTATRNRYGVDAHYFNKNLQLILRDFESFTPDELARSLIILAKVADEKVVAQAQHSVPEGVTIERDVAGTIHIKVGDFDFIQLQYQRPYTDNASTWKLAERIASLLAAAPSKEGL